MTNPEKLNSQPVTRRRFLLIGAATGVTGSLGFLAANIFKYRTSIVPEPLSVAVAQEPATSTPVPTETPIATTTPGPIDTPTAVVPTIAPTFTSEPTKPPLTPTPEPSLTPTPTETPKPVEKSPLPEYGAFMGDFVNKETGTQGMITLASIPQKNGTQQIVVFWMARDAKYQNKTVFEAYSLELETIQGTTMKAISTDNLPKWKKGTFNLEANWDQSSQTLIGTLTTKINPGGQLKIETQRFEVNFIGTGKDKVLEAAKKMKLVIGGYGGNWTTVRVDEFEREISLP
ncbi:hypothetical protein HY407_01015 [Candidatus Gottesmanbacteria bacterium]|nr:hypothetical protein [Candidatus Gottesmanbacteria bacterium]